jgi:hypothetical protein
MLKTETRRKLRKRQSEDEIAAGIKKRQVAHAGRLVITHLDQYSAIELWESPFPLGLDTVSAPEGVYCDMTEKTLWPVWSMLAGGD